MKISARTKCPVCDGKNNRYIYTHNFEPIDKVGILTSFDVTVCDVCGMIYANNIMSQDIADYYYQEYSKYEVPQISSELKEDYRRLADYIAHLISDKSAVTADVGCGYGFLLDELVELGYGNLIGVDLSAQNCERLQKEKGIKAIRKSLFDLVPENFYKRPDCIILSAVLEHIVDLRLAVETLRGLLTDNGVLVVNVPKAERFVDFASQYPFEEISTEHINYFTVDTLKLLMELNGMELINHTEIRNSLIAGFRKKSRPNYIQSYTATCQNAIKPSVDIIGNYMKNQRPIIIYGAGTLCQYLFANSLLRKCNIAAIVDGNTHYHGKTLSGIEILPPSELKNRKFAGVDIFTISYRYNDEIATFIRNMGLTNEIVSIPIDNHQN